MIGRSHGIHAEPITFGLKFALWHAEMERNRERLCSCHGNRSHRKNLRGRRDVCQHRSLVEKRCCRKLGLNAASISNQVIQRDRHAEFSLPLPSLGAPSKRSP